MPEIGEIRSAGKLGYKNRGKMAWTACSLCGKARWYKNRRDRFNICRVCSCKQQGLNRRGDKTPSWKGGRSKDKDGYIRLKLHPDDPFFPMARKDWYVPEHRLVMAKHLGRLLLPQESIHHINGNHADNRLGNLKLFPNESEHQEFHNLINYLIFILSTGLAFRCALKESSAPNVET